MNMQIKLTINMEHVFKITKRVSFKNLFSIAANSKFLRLNS